MANPSLTTLIAKNSKILKIVWGVLLFAIVLYSGLSLTFSYSRISDPGAALKYIFYTIAVLLALTSILIYIKVFSEKSYKEKLKREMSAEDLAKDIGTNRVDENKKRALETLSTNELKLYGLSGSFFVPYVICWALNESIVLIGFVMAYVFNDGYEIVPFALAALLLHVQMYPKLEQIVDKARTMPELQ